jgi:[ribosomal protein S5]-alanine N-acetyltransferase
VLLLAATRTRRVYHPRRSFSSRLLEFAYVCRLRNQHRTVPWEDGPDAAEQLAPDAGEVFPFVHIRTEDKKMTWMTIATPRLTLLGADRDMLLAALGGPRALERAIGAIVPTEWPPEHLDVPVLRWMLDGLGSLPSDAPWRMYLIVRNGERREAIGTCGFKGPPDAEGTVEVGYSVVPSQQRQGYASEATAALVDCAMHHGARSVAAETFPELVASVRVMEKCGLKLVGPGSQEGTIRYAVTGEEREG